MPHPLVGMVVLARLNVIEIIMYLLAFPCSGGGIAMRHQVQVEDWQERRGCVGLLSTMLRLIEAADLHNVSPPITEKQLSYMLLQNDLYLP